MLIKRHKKMPENIEKLIHNYVDTLSTEPDLGVNNISDKSLHKIGLDGFIKWLREKKTKET